MTMLLVELGSAIHPEPWWLTRRVAATFDASSLHLSVTGHGQQNHKLLHRLHRVHTVLKRFQLKSVEPFHQII